ncbi:MAG: efflux RND transporter permease subunit, partial [Candidatus Velthaea sp.]
ITLVDVVVFFPLAFLSGFVGKYFVEFGIVVTVATLFSLFVSFTLTPMLAAAWSVKKRSTAPPRALAWFQIGFDMLNRWYRDKALQLAFRHRWFVFLASFLLVMNAVTLGAGPDVMRGMALLDGAIAAVVLVWWIFGRLLPRPGIPLAAGAVLALRVAYATLVGAVIGVIAAKASGNDGIVLGTVAGVYAATLAVLVMRRPRSAKTFPVAPVHAGGSISGIAFCAGVGALLFTMAALRLYVPFEFIPSTQQGQISGTLTYRTGTPLVTTAAALERIESAAIKLPHVDSVRTVAGVKPSGFGSTQGGFVGRFNVTLDKRYRAKTDDTIQALRKLVPALAPGAMTTVSERGGGGSGSPINYTLSGPEDQIDGAASKLAAYIRSIPGTANVQTGAETEAPRLNVNIDPAKAAELGVSPGAAATAARTAVGGVVATRVRTQSGLVDIRVEYPEATRNSIEVIRRIPVRASDGSMVPLAMVAEFQETKAPTKINRMNRQRVAQVSGDIDHSSPSKLTLGDVSSRIDAQLRVPGFLPPGVTLGSQGDTKFFKEFTESMLISVIVSFAMVYMLMVVLYGNFGTPFVIMFSIPVALVGALFGLRIFGQTLNLFSMLGMIMLFGLVAKNGILLADYANTLRKRGGMRAVEAMTTAAGTRLRPILMTTAAMVFGMLPLALGLAEGGEIRRSMGVVLIGGLSSSLLLTLFLVPIAYTGYIGWLEWRADRRALREEQAAGPLAVPAGAMGD